MSDFDYSLILDLFNLGTCEIQIHQSHCPRTVMAIEGMLPIGSRGLKRGSKFTITTDLTTRAENEKLSFDKGQISVDPSSGNITIFLETTDLATPQNLLGKIDDLERLNEVKLSQGLEIRSLT